MDDAFLRTENALLRSRLAEAEIDQLQSQEERKELRRQIGELARGNVAL
jgi:regulator of replication initiation timing